MDLKEDLPTGLYLDGLGKVAAGSAQPPVTSKNFPDLFRNPGKYGLMEDGMGNLRKRTSTTNSTGWG